MALARSLEEGVEDGWHTGKLRNRPVARGSIPKSLATASSALQSQDQMVKKRIDDALALFYVECSIGVHL